MLFELNYGFCTHDVQLSFEQAFLCQFLVMNRCLQIVIDPADSRFQVFRGHHGCQLVIRSLDFGLQRTKIRFQ